MIPLTVDLGERFLSHWRSLRHGGSLLPSLPDMFDNVDPVLQPWTTVLDNVDANLQQWRLIGTGLCNAIDFDITGLNFFDFVDKTQHAALYEVHQLMCSTPCGQRRMATAHTSQGRTLNIETTSLPCTDTQGRPRHLMGVHMVSGALSMNENMRPRMTINKTTWIDIGAGIPNMEPPNIG